MIGHEAILAGLRKKHVCTEITTYSIDDVSCDQRKIAELFERLTRQDL